AHLPLRGEVARIVAFEDETEIVAMRADKGRSAADILRTAGPQLRQDPPRRIRRGIPRLHPRRWLVLQDKALGRVSWRGRDARFSAGPLLLRLIGFTGWKPVPHFCRRWPSHVACEFRICLRWHRDLACDPRVSCRWHR